MKQSPLRRFWFVLWLLFSLGIAPGRASGQQLYALDYLGSQIELFSIDPTSGAVAPLIATGADSVLLASSAFDPIGRRFFFQGGIGGSDTLLFTVNVATGAVSHVPLSVIGAYIGLHYDVALGRLYGLDYVGAQIELFVLDPTSGTATPLIATGANSLILAGSAFDPIGRRFFFQGGIGGPETLLFTVNVATGVGFHVPILANGGGFVGLQYDVPAGRLYGLDYVGAQIELFVLDPTSGAVTPLIATGAASLLLEDSAFDPVGRRFFFQGGIGGPETLLFTINVATGATSHVPILAMGGGLVGLKYDTGPRTAGIPVLGLPAIASLAFLLALVGALALRK